VPKTTRDFSSLERTIEGTLIARGTANLLAALHSLIWNARKPTRSPDAIVTVASVQDVCQSVRFARERGLKVSVRGSGHNYFGAPVRDGGLLLNLGGFRRLRSMLKTAVHDYSRQ
jgi:FAD/FMN-containing dehydrogenase